MSLNPSKPGRRVAVIGAGPGGLSAGLVQYDRQRVSYTAKTTAFARAMGRFYHALPPPLDILRDLFLDHSRIPESAIRRGVTREAQALLRSILEQPVQSRHHT